ncbi:MAG TPA: malate dehydrogenase, partial [Actinomycetota bacterium]|nr:malate dehydrogenase [Actinomycetota bacterium]
RTTALRLAERGLADVCLVDVIEGWPQGLALDIRHSAPLQGFDTGFIGTNDYGDSADSDVVVITAGLPRSPGMSRMDLLERNSEIVGSVADEIKARSPGAVVIVVTNPLDEMTFLTALKTGIARERVMGMAGLLDSARLAYYIAEELQVSPLEVDAMTLGSHGEQMVPLPRQATVGGRPLPELVDQGTLERLYARTRDAGAEIVGLLRKGSAFYAPSAATAKMVEAVLTDSKESFPVSAWVTGQYGVTDVYLGVPARLGAGGIEEVIELELNEEELAQLREAAEAIRAKCDELTKLIEGP